MKKYLLTLLLIVFLISNVFVQPRPPEVIRVSLPNKPPVKLIPYAQLNFPLIAESSGLVKSRLWPDVFWTHNDHGNEARIFPVRRDGSIMEAKWGENYSGILVVDGVNIDWEDITTDNDGNLIIGAFGNNSSTRRDLAVYILREPYPPYTLITRINKKIQFYYPDQDGFPPTKENFDAEACFWAKGKIYILSKHRSDSFTTLYRLDSMDPFDLNPLTILGTFDSRDMVTGADATPDGNRLAVLTFNAVWLFEVTGNSDDYFNGRISWLPIEAGQCEGICFDGETLIISNEERDLFEVPLDRLVVVKE